MLEAVKRERRTYVQGDGSGSESPNDGRVRKSAALRGRRQRDRLSNKKLKKEPKEAKGRLKLTLRKERLPWRR